MSSTMMRVDKEFADYLKKRREEFARLGIFLTYPKIQRITLRELKPFPADKFEINFRRKKIRIN